MAQVLVGYDHTGSIQSFDEDGDILKVEINSMMCALNFARLLTKDEIKKGTFALTLGATQAYATPFTDRIIIQDTSGSDGYLVNSPVGEYGILYATNAQN